MTLPTADLLRFLAAIRREPGDNATRMAFSDALEDHADERAFMVREAFAYRGGRWRRWHVFIPEDLTIARMDFGSSSTAHQVLAGRIVALFPEVEVCGCADLDWPPNPSVWCQRCHGLGLVAAVAQPV